MSKYGFERGCVLHPGQGMHEGGVQRTEDVLVYIPGCRPMYLRLCHDRRCLELFRELIEKTYGVRFVDYKHFARWVLVKE